VTATGSIGHEASRLHAEPPGHDNMPVRSVLPPGRGAAGAAGAALILSTAQFGSASDVKRRQRRADCLAR
jgi:hypothetical protein